MKKLAVTILPFIAAIILSACLGCKKPKSTHPFGTVVEYGTEKPIPGATVHLSDCEGEVFGSTNCREVAQAVADSSGKFKFFSDGFVLSAEAEGYFSSGPDVVFPAFDGDGTNASIVPLYPHALLQVTIRNVSGQFYGFGSSQLGKSSPKFIIPKGQEEGVTVELKGNTDFQLLFFILTDENHSTTDLSHVNVVDSNNNLIPISLENSLSPYVKLFIKGHETTSITISY